MTPGTAALEAMIERLGAAAKESAVTFRRAGSAEAWPREGIDGLAAVVIADAIVAETGAIVLFGDDRRLRPIMASRALTAHARPEALVPTFAEALERFDGAGRMISICGPSRTADIEKTLVVGVHGPSEVTIVLHPPTA